MEHQCFKNSENKTMKSIMSGQDNVVMNHKKIYILNTCGQEDTKRCKTQLILRTGT